MLATILLAMRDSDHLLPVGGGALDRVNHHDRRGDLPHRRQVPADEDLVDDPADDPGGQRRGDGDQGHHRKGEGIAFPVPCALIEKQSPQQGVRGVFRNDVMRSRIGRQCGNEFLLRRAGPPLPPSNNGVHIRRARLHSILISSWKLSFCLEIGCQPPDE